MNRKVLMLSLITLLVTSCTQVRPPHSIEEEKFCNYTELGFYNEGRPLIVYDKYQHQISINSQRKEFRIQNDNQDIFFDIKVLSTLRFGESVNCDLHLKTQRVNNHYILESDVVKVQNNKYWIWNEEYKSGVIIQFGL